MRTRSARPDSQKLMVQIYEIHEKLDLSVCWEETGQKPITCRGVDINKGDTANANYRSRLVAREYKTEEKLEWYAATPPSECFRLMLSKLACNRSANLMYADVSRAYFYALAARPVFVDFPAEDRGPGDENRCGLLLMSMYGTRDAALNWALEYGENLKNAGYALGKSNPCIFHHKDTCVTIMVHGDDFGSVGKPEHVKEVRDAFEQKYKMKVDMLGNGEGEQTEVITLNNKRENHWERRAHGG